MSAPACSIKPKRPRKRTKEQLKIIDKFLLKHPKLSCRLWERRLNEYERTEVNKLWEILKNRLNACGPEKDVRGWKDVLIRQQGKGILSPTQQQFKLIDEFFLDHPKIPYRPFPKRLNGYERTKVSKIWAYLRQRLNSCGPPEMHLKGWKQVCLRRRRLQTRFAKNIEALHNTSCAAIQPALPIRIELAESKVKSCSSDDAVFDIIEPDLGPQTSQNDKNMTITSTISQDEFHIKSELDLENGHEDVHELGNENVHKDSNELDEEKVHKDSHELDEDCVHEDSHPLQPALQIRMEPPEFCVKIYNNNDGLFDIIEPNLAKEASPNDNNMTTTSTISQDDLHIKNELDEENVHEDSHELDEKNVHGDFHELDEENVHGDFHELDDENNTHEDFHPTNSDEFQTQPQPEQQCQKCRCCCSSRTRSNELFEKQFEMQTKFMQNLTEQREHFHIEIIKILEENNKLLKENLRQKKEENDAREVKAEELRLKKIELKIMKAINDVKLKKLNL